MITNRIRHLHCSLRKSKCFLSSSVPIACPFSTQITMSGSVSRINFSVIILCSTLSAEFTPGVSISHTRRVSGNMNGKRTNRNIFRLVVHAVIHQVFQTGIQIQGAIPFIAESILIRFIKNRMDLCSAGFVLRFVYFLPASAFRRVDFPALIVAVIKTFIGTCC